MPEWSPYNFTFNNPLSLIDPLGLSQKSIHLDKYGNVLKNEDDGRGYNFGEIGGTLKVDRIYTNTLNTNIKEAKDLFNPFTFKNYVKTKRKWDLKNNKKTI